MSISGDDEWLGFWIGRKPTLLCIPHAGKIWNVELQQTEWSPSLLRFSIDDDQTRLWSVTAKSDNLICAFTERDKESGAS